MVGVRTLIYAMRTFLFERVIIRLFLNGPFWMRTVRISRVFLRAGQLSSSWSCKILLASLKSAGSLQSSSVCCGKHQKGWVFSQHPGLRPKPASNHLPVRIDLKTSMYIFIDSWYFGCILGIGSIIFFSSSTAEFINRLPLKVPGKRASSASSGLRSASLCQAGDTAEVICS